MDDDSNGTCCGGFFTISFVHTSTVPSAESRRLTNQLVSGRWSRFPSSASMVLLTRVQVRIISTLGQVDRSPS